MGTIRTLLAAVVVLCASPFLHCQEATRGPQQEEQAAALKPGPLLGARLPNADTNTSSTVLLPLDSTSPLVSTAISQVKSSFKIYPDVIGPKPLPTTGTWSVPSTPFLTFLPACAAWKASCLEVQYSVPSRNVVCHWTVLFPPPTLVNGQEVQNPTVINEDANAAQYMMMVRLQPGMNYPAVQMQPPAYPASPNATEWTGAVSLQIVVSPQGKVVSIPAIFGPTVLQPSAAQAVSKWLYGQTKVGGQAVARSFTVQVNYSVGTGN